MSFTDHIIKKPMRSGLYKFLKSIQLDGNIFLCFKLQTEEFCVSNVFPFKPFAQFI